ncbi:hypothetical protein B0H16DRAFT_1467157 [Mycena metata]|uniref:Uncharacterized protein n=1 Tax=Mycena metata TaxID=1033252 RepID=A0AAD7I5B6_9AGAR|nr:hypothetical protein B0H16DRAFT_1467157 [Mycena metata]
MPRRTPSRMDTLLDPSLLLRVQRPREPGAGGGEDLPEDLLFVVCAEHAHFIFRVCPPFRFLLVNGVVNGALYAGESKDNSGLGGSGSSRRGGRPRAPCSSVSSTFFVNPFDLEDMCERMCAIVPFRVQVSALHAVDGVKDEAEVSS